MCSVVEEARLTQTTNQMLQQNAAWQCQMKIKKTRQHQQRNTNVAESSSKGSLYLQLRSHFFFRQ
jgi:hypothetical protein